MQEIMLPGPCAICRTPGKFKNAGIWTKFTCDLCGTYLAESEFLRKTGWPQVDTADREIIHLYSGYAREKSDLASASGLDGDLAEFMEETMPSIRSQLPRTIRDRAAKLLQAMWRRSAEFGATFNLQDATDLPLGYARSVGELFSLGKFLKEVKFVDMWMPFIGGISGSVSVAGVEEIERLRATNRDSAQGFVAMSFDDGLRSLFDGPILTAIVAAGYKPMRIDRKDHNNQIVDEMLAEIRRSRFVVADFTSHRNGVYFEAGFAMGLGIPVIWLVRKDHLNGAHFDTKQYSHLVWEPGDDLGERLYNRIRATIGEGPIVPGSPQEVDRLLQAVRKQTPNAI